uniref:THAP-type domain-containing protein n=1 Tax=Amphiprion ocellaris TaxID=80972 RepID=A0A3Q1AP10_AMPOC
FPNLHCCVPLCNSSSKYDTTLTFHKFPPDPELRRTWIESIQREKLHHNYALASETELKERIERLTGGQKFGLQRFAGSDEDIQFFTRTLKFKRIYFVLSHAFILKDMYADKRKLSIL